MTTVGTSSALRGYEPSFFHSLADFHDSRSELHRSRDTIAALGSIICKYGYQDVVGVTLLHKHFEIEDDEVIVRRFVAADHALMRPEKTIQALDQAVPYLWGYSLGGDRPPGWYPLEFVEWPEARCAGFELLAYADAMLDEIAEELVAFGLHDLFGLAGLFSRSRFVLDDGLTLVETTDEAARRLDLKVVRKEVVATLDTTQTLWTFS